MQCSNCGKNIPYTGNVCPYCNNDKGKDKAFHNKIMVASAAILIVGVVWFKGCSGREPSESDKNESTRLTHEAALLVMNNDLNAALRLCNDAIKLNRNNGEALLARGIIWMKLGAKDAAKDDLENAESILKDGRADKLLNAIR